MIRRRRCDCGKIYKGNKVVTFLIIRHGFSETNSKKIFAGSTNARLTEQGVLQGKLACEYLFNNYKIDAIYSSDLSRAEDTVKRLSELTGLPVVKKTALREMHCGIWENLSIETLVQNYGEQFKRWAEIDDDATPEQGETWAEVSERVYKEFVNIAKVSEGKTVVVATHGVAIRTFRGKYLDLPMNEWKDKLPYAPNASVTVVEYSNGKFTEKVVIDDYLGALKTEMPKGI